MPTTEEIGAAYVAWKIVWMGAAYQDMARDAIRAALIAAERVRNPVPTLPAIKD